MCTYSELINNLMIDPENINNNCSIACITNMTVEPYLTPCLKHVFCVERIAINMTYVPIEEYMDVDFSKFNIVIIWIQFKYIFNNNNISSICESKEDNLLDYCEIILKNIKNTVTCSILWIGFDEYDLKQIYLYGYTFYPSNLISVINRSISKNDKIIAININSLIALIGINNAYI